MRAVIQRVVKADVSVEGKTVGEIGRGLLVLLGVGRDDSEKDARYIADKISNLRIFEDSEGKMNLSVRDVEGEVLVVSQFTLFADCRKGRRPSFINAGELELSHIEACERYREIFTIDLDRKYGAVIVSAGGSPKDVNLLQAHKALRHASTALEEGGLMLAALACAGGVGSDSLDGHFEKGRNGVPVRVQKGYTLNTQTAVSTYDLTGRFSIYLRSMMEDSDISRFGFCPWHEEFTGPLLECYGDEDILVIPNASSFLFRTAKESTPIS